MVSIYSEPYILRFLRFSSNSYNVVYNPLTALTLAVSITAPIAESTLRLKKMVADLSLDKQILKEVASGNF